MDMFVKSSNLLSIALQLVLLTASVLIMETSMPHKRCRTKPLRGSFIAPRSPVVAFVLTSRPRL